MAISAGAGTRRCLLHAATLLHAASVWPGLMCWQYRVQPEGLLSPLLLLEPLCHDAVAAMMLPCHTLSVRPCHKLFAPLSHALRVPPAPFNWQLPKKGFTCDLEES